MRLFVICLIISVCTTGCDFTVNEDAFEEEEPGTLLLQNTNDLQVLDWTQKGGEVLLKREGNRGDGIYAVDPTTGTVRTVVKTLSLEGDRLNLFHASAGDGGLFIHSGRGRGESYQYALDRLDLNTRQTERLLDDTGFVPAMAAVPSGEHLLYISQRHEQNLRRLEVTTRVDTGLAMLDRIGTSDLFFSPEADRLVYVDRPGRQVHLHEVTSGAVHATEFTDRLLDIYWEGGVPYLLLLESQGDSILDEVLRVQPLQGASSPLRAEIPDDSRTGRSLYLSPENTLFDLQRRRFYYWRIADDLLYLIDHDLETGAERGRASHACPTRCSFSCSTGCSIQHMSMGAEGSQLVYLLRFFDEEGEHFEGDRLFTVPFTQ